MIGRVEDEFLRRDWTTVSLKAIVTKLVDGSHNPPGKRESGVPMLSARNIQNNQIVFEEYRFISEEDFEKEHARTRISPGDVLLTIVGTIGRSAVVPASAKRFALQRSVAVITPAGVLPKYLMYQFQSPFLQRHFEKNARGTAQKGVYLKTLGQTPILVAPLGQQELIIAEIDKQFSRLDEAVASLKRVKANLKRYKASVLKAAVEGKLTEDWRAQHPNVEPASKLLERILAERRAAWEQAELDKMKLKGRVAINDQWRNRYKTPMKLDEDDYETTPSSWVQVSLDSIASLITDGKHGDCSDEPGSGYYFLSAKDVHGGQLHYSEARQIDKDEFMEVHYRTNLELNDVLITNAGTIGRVAVAKDRYKLPFTTFQKSVAIIKPTKASVSSVFLAYYLEANVAKMQAKSAGTAVQNLLLSTLKAARFCLPSRDEQLEIVAEVDRRLSVIDELEAAVQANLTRANRLRQSILSEAFSGRLVKERSNNHLSAIAT